MTMLFAYQYAVTTVAILSVRPNKDSAIYEKFSSLIFKGFDRND